MAHGRRKADGVPIYCVPSATEPGRWHSVAWHGARLVCDCAAGQHNRICVLRGATYVYLFIEAQRRERLVSEVAQAMRDECDERALHDAVRHLDAAERARDAR